MLNKIIILLTILVLFTFNFIAISGADIPYLSGFSLSNPQGKGSDTKSYGNGASNQISGSSSNSIVLPAEVPALNITRKIIYPVREGGFFNETTEKISVLVEVTCLKKEGLENLEVWEIPGDGLEIENCSYPIRTYDIGQILDYEISDKSVLKLEDINHDLTHIKERFRKKFDNTPDPLYLHIYMLLNNSTQRFLDKNLRAGDGDNKLRVALFNDFNKIIDNNTDKDFNISNFKGSGTIFRSGLLYRGFSSNSEKFSKLNDFRLFKRRLLEDAFPEDIRRISYYKEHEDHEIADSPKLRILIDRTDIGEAPLQEGETLIFKYYLYPEKLGRTDIRSIIKAKGFWHQEVTDLKIIERSPQFKIDYAIGSKELTLNTPTRFEYSITYLGGDESTKSFKVNVSAPSFCKLIDEKNRTLEDKLSIPKSLSIGRDDNFTVIAIYNKTGSTYSPPTVSIVKFQKTFSEDIQVLTPNDQEAKITYEAYSIDYLYWAKLFGVGALIFAVIESGLVLYLDREHKKTIDKFLKENNELLKAQKEVMDAHNATMIALKNAIELPHISSTKSVDSCYTKQYLDEWTKPEYYS